MANRIPYHVLVNGESVASGTYSECRRVYDGLYKAFQIHTGSDFPTPQFWPSLVVAVDDATLRTSG